MLYDGAIRFVEEADERLGTGNVPGAGERISRVLAIVAELQGALDFRHNPPLCSALDGLYTFMTQRLLEANGNRDGGALEEVLGLLRSLRDTWSEAADLVRKEQAEKRAGFRPGGHGIAFARVV